MHHVARDEQKSNRTSINLIIRMEKVERIRKWILISHRTNDGSMHSRILVESSWKAWGFVCWTLDSFRFEFLIKIFSLKMKNYENIEKLHRGICDHNFFQSHCLLIAWFVSFWIFDWDFQLDDEKWWKYWIIFVDVSAIITFIEATVTSNQEILNLFQDYLENSFLCNVFSINDSDRLMHPSYPRGSYL